MKYSLRGSLILICLAGACSGSSRPTATCPGPAASSQPAPDNRPAVAEAKADPGSRREGALILRHAPLVPTALQNRLRQYLGTRYAILGDLSDDGKAMLVSTRFALTSQVHLLRNPMGARTQLTFIGEPTRSPTFAPGRTDAVFYKSDIGGNERYQIFRLDLKQGKTTLLTDGQSRHGDYIWSHDGKRMAFTNNARNGKDMDLYLGDGQSATSSKLLLERQGHWFLIDWSHDGKRLLVGEYISINDSRLYTVDIATKRVERVTPPTPTASYRAAVFHNSGQYIFAATDREGEFVELYRVDLKTKQWKALSRDIRWNVEDIALSSDGRTLAFATNEDGYSALHLLDTRTLKHRRVKGVPRGVIASLAFSRQASSTLGLSIIGSTSPGDSYTYYVRRNKIVRWTASEVGGLTDFVEPALLHYPTFDGRKIPCFYYKPAGQGPHPVIVWIHGGPEGQSRPTFRSVIQYLVKESGVAVLVPNVRGSDGYGKSYLLMDNGYKREDSVKDIGALLDWVAQQKDLDNRRLGVLGGSYGGYMVLASLVHFPQRIVAGVDVVGISNFVTFLKNTKAYRRDLRRAEYGDERDAKMNAFLEKISPSNNMAKIRSSLFVAHGANDPRVPLSETDQIVDAAKKALLRSNRDVWYMVATNEGHGFRKKPNRDKFWELSVMFFEKYLKPKE